MKIAIAMWPLMVPVSYAAAADRALVSVMRHGSADVFSIQLLKRVPVSADLDLIIALGYPKKWSAPTGNSGWWGGESLYTTLAVRH